LIIKQLQASFQTLFCSCFFHLHHNLHHKQFSETRRNIGGEVFGNTSYFKKACKVVIKHQTYRNWLFLILKMIF
jgi:hypothetical protein